MQFQTKSYYGFIDTLPASRKKIVKKLLDQQLNIAGILTNMHGIYRYADFIVLALKKADCILKVSVITHGMRMTSRGKEYGEFLNPKTEYKLYTSPNEYFSLNKTYFDFGKYIEAHFVTMSNVQEYLQEESRQQLINEKLAHEKADQKAQEKAESELKSQKFEAWLKAENKKYAVAANESILKAIYDECFPEGYMGFNYDVLVLADHINISECCEELILRLRNFNKASIKVFERYTGIKLARAYKERVQQLKKLTPDDFVNDCCKGFTCILTFNNGNSFEMYVDVLTENAARERVNAYINEHKINTPKSITIIRILQ